jgi:hypothetical protein
MKLPAISTLFIRQIILPAILVLAAARQPAPTTDDDDGRRTMKLSVQ